MRAGAPAARIVVDANEGWTAEGYAALAPALVGLGVEMVEQPLPAGADAALAGMARPLPVCADESCHDRASLPALAGRYDMVNIKLDKTGGLTEALALRAAARGRRLRRDGRLHGRLEPRRWHRRCCWRRGRRWSTSTGRCCWRATATHGLVYDERGVHPPTPELWG